MKDMNMRFLVFILTFVALIVSSAAFAKAPVPAAGNYPCYTRQISLQARDRLRTSTATLETDWRNVLEQSTQIVPAGITLFLDGRNSYRVLGTRARGTYNYSPTSGQVVFAGEASELRLRSYFVKNGLYIFQFQPNDDVFYHCEFDSGNRRIGASNQGQSQGAAGEQSGQNQVTAPPRSARPIAARDLTGRFVGSYSCSQGRTTMRLDLMVDPQGRLRGTFAFGGSDGVPAGSFSMLGVWSSLGFSLSGDRWINRPEGYSMVNLNGYLVDAGRLGGEVLAQGCSSFDVRRQ
jgi:hypothetical protein